MGDIKDPSENAAVDKIKELSEEIGICMFCTYDESGKLIARPMSAQKVDDRCGIWFLSAKDSNKNAEITQNNKVELLYSKGHGNFMSVHGTAQIFFDKEIIRQLWQPLAKVWFQGGVDDPRITAIKVAPEDGHYWDTKHGQMVEFAKMVASLATGETMDDGIQGDLKP